MSTKYRWSDWEWSDQWNCDYSYRLDSKGNARPNSKGEYDYRYRSTGDRGRSEQIQPKPPRDPNPSVSPARPIKPPPKPAPQPNAESEIASQPSEAYNSQENNYTTSYNTTTSPSRSVQLNSSAIQQSSNTVSKDQSSFYPQSGSWRGGQKQGNDFAKATQKTLSITIQGQDFTATRGVAKGNFISADLVSKLAVRKTKTKDHFYDDKHKKKYDIRELITVDMTCEKVAEIRGGELKVIPSPTFKNTVILGTEIMGRLEQAGFASVTAAFASTSISSSSYSSSSTFSTMPARPSSISTSSPGPIVYSPTQTFGNSSSSRTGTYPSSNANDYSTLHPGTTSVSQQPYQTPRPYDLEDQGYESSSDQPIYVSNDPQYQES